MFSNDHINAEILINVVCLCTILKGAIAVQVFCFGSRFFMSSARLLIEAVPSSSQSVPICVACQRPARGRLCFRAAGGLLEAVCQRCFFLGEIAVLCRLLDNKPGWGARADRQLLELYSALRTAHQAITGPRLRLGVFTSRYATESEGKSQSESEGSRSRSRTPRTRRARR